MNIAATGQQVNASALPKSREISSQGVKEADEKRTKEELDGVKKPATPRYDEYIHTEESALADSAGIYEPSMDENGNPQIAFDDPEKVKEEPKTEKCTVNTDKADAEVRKLKEEMKKIQMELKQAADDPERKEKLESQLSQVDSELQAKDNDAYRKQNATVTYG